MLHKLPKDLLIKLLTEIQDPEKLSDDMLYQQFINVKKEIKKRKIKNVIKELSSDEDYKYYANILKEIRDIEYTPKVVNICFNGNIKIDLCLDFLNLCDGDTPLYYQNKKTGYYMERHENNTSGKYNDYINLAKMIIPKQKFVDTIIEQFERFCKR